MNARDFMKADPLRNKQVSYFSVCLGPIAWHPNLLSPTTITPRSTFPSTVITRPIGPAIGPAAQGARESIAPTTPACRALRFGMHSSDHLVGESARATRRVLHGARDDACAPVNSSLILSLSAHPLAT
jgi:hypothetical protein